jgi:anti-sigma B factor antagonist
VSFPQRYSSSQLDLASTPPGPASLRVQAVIAADRCVLRLAGELDITSAETVDQVVRGVCATGHGTGVTLDLSRVRFMDSTGIRAVLVARDLCAQAESDFRLIPGPAQVQRLFEVVGLLDALPFETSSTGVES